MKVIDLLNKIANGEEVPKKIICDGVTYKYVFRDTIIKGAYDYESESGNYLTNNLTDRFYLTDILIKEIDIIEEDKKIEKIGYLRYSENEVESILHRKIDELIDEVNKLKNN